MNANNLPEAKLLRKKLKNGLIVDKWDLVTIIEKQQAEIEALKQDVIGWMDNAGQIPDEAYFERLFNERK